VQVLAGREGLLEPGVVGQVGHDPHLDLAVVGGHQALEARPGDEALADLAALLGADRDVLQVRVVAGQPPGRGDHLLEGRVDAAVVGDGRQQLLLHDHEQPGHLAVQQQRLDDRVRADEVLQRVGVRSCSRS
jgi:hypothetical protein